MNQLAVAQQEPPVIRPKRMTLNSVTTGKVEGPRRVVLYATEKVGKSTFAAGAPSPIFICSEDGTSQLDVSRFPEPKCFSDVLDAIQVLLAEPHGFKTLVLDTLDWLEPLVHAHVCEKNGWANIETPGYGKGPSAALDQWRLLLARLEELQKKRGMHIILLAHSWIKTFKNPEAVGDYDRYELKLSPKASGVIKEWCEAVLFANHETLTTEKGGRTRGVSSGARVMHTERRAAWDAGNRYSLPETLPLSWDEFDAACLAGSPGALAGLVDAFNVLVKEVDADTAKLAGEWLAKGTNSKDPKILSVMINRLKAKSQIAASNNQQNQTNETKEVAS